jgi:hypothetical protein
MKRVTIYFTHQKDGSVLCEDSEGILFLSASDAEACENYGNIHGEVLEDESIITDGVVSP